MNPQCSWRQIGLAILALGLASGRGTAALGAGLQDEAALSAMVEADWAAQEQRLGRKPGHPDAIRDVSGRAGRLLQDMQGMPGGPERRLEAETLQRLRAKAEAADRLDEAARLALYREIRTAVRKLMRKNPLLASRPILFLKQRRFICQMLHEYVGYYYNYGGIAGGGVYVLEEPGRSLKVRDLVAGRLPRGNYTTAALSYDAKTIYFAFAEIRDVQRKQPGLVTWIGFPAAAQVPPELNYFGPGRNCFHLFAMDADGKNLRQLTFGGEDDFDPCPLPDGRIAFLSSRRGGFCRCGGGFEPVPTYTLHSMERDGRDIKVLSVHETNEWHPAMLHDGRIVYCRWDYVDRSAAHFHGLWTSNSDGSSPSILFGNYTQRISTCFQPRAVPGSNKIAFIAGAHHAPVGGSLVLLDPTRVRLDPRTGEDQFGALERLTSEVCFPETSEGWPKSFYVGPWPLSENYYLVGFSFEPLPGWGSRVLRDSRVGLYYLDRFGNLELLCEDPDISCMNPIPLAPQPAPPAIPSILDPNMGDEGELVLTDVRRSLLRLPEGRRVRELRVFQVLPKETTYMANNPRIGHANQESARMLLGTVPVEADGSAYFRAPACKPLYFQAVDGNGRAVHSMRTVTYLQPGERRGCVGCHERPGTSPPVRPTLATRRPPSRITPGPDGTRPMSYPRLVQPVLDRRCARCHDGSKGQGKSALVLTGDPAGHFTRSYENLKPFLRWHENGGQSISQIVTRPGRLGADESPLAGILDDATHAAALKLPAEDRQRLYIWLDGNVPFYGTYAEDQQRAQLSGKAAPPPRLQ